MKLGRKMTKTGESGESAKNNFHHKKQNSTISKTAFFVKMVKGELILSKVFMMKIILKIPVKPLWKTLLELNSPLSPRHFEISLKRG